MIKHYLGLIFPLLFFGTSPTLAQNSVATKTTTKTAAEITSYDESKITQVANSRYWHLLMHYRPALLTKYSSHVSSSPFFLAPDGKTNPTSELKATLHFFETNQKIGRYQQTPQCAFPERFRFLKKEFDLKLKTENCSELNDWIEGFSGESATLVYSSAFPNNPASILGHTLLRINSKKKKKDSTTKQDLLDYSVGYAAAMGDDSALQLAYKGLFGGYEGIISVQPYYMKVNEYVSSENRDLWEYDLNMTPEQIQNMLRHIWELQNSAHINYYFIDENCAYFLLALLEVANPDWNFIDHLPWYVAPAKTIKVLYETPGIVSHVHFRPSAFKVMQYRMGQLNKKQLGTLSTLIDTHSMTKTGPIDSPITIDAALDYMQYLRAENKGKQTPEEKNFYRELLVARSKMDTPEATLDESKLSQDSRPDQSHETMQIGSSLGTVNNQLGQEFHLRMGLSDFVNDDTGLIPHAAMKFLDAQFRYIEKPNRFVAESLQFVQVRSLFPRNEVQKSLSWGINAEVITPHELGCEHCKALHGEASGGYTWQISKQWTQAVFFTANIDGSDIYTHGYRLGPSFDLETVYEHSKRTKTHLLIREFFYNTDFSGNFVGRTPFTDILLEQGWALSKKWDIRAKVRFIPGDNVWPTYSEFFTGANFYFN